MPTEDKCLQPDISNCPLTLKLVKTNLDFRIFKLVNSPISRHFFLSLVFRFTKGRLSHHLCVECFSQLSFDSEMYTKSAANSDFVYIYESNESSKLNIPSTLNIDLILWHTQLIVCAANVKSWFKSWVFPFTSQAYTLPHTLNCICVSLSKFHN